MAPATADVLFGDYNPAGRLTDGTFPRHGQLPLYYNFKTSGCRRVFRHGILSLYYFGYGLSTTNISGGLQRYSIGRRMDNNYREVALKRRKNRFSSRR